jgi:hypothetical protein
LLTNLACPMTGLSYSYIPLGLGSPVLAEALDQSGCGSCGNICGTYYPLQVKSSDHCSSMRVQTSCPIAISQGLCPSGLTIPRKMSSIISTEPY